MYNRCQIQPSSTDLEIPELEEDSDQDQFTDPDNLITHHNTHQESERILIRNVNGYNTNTSLPYRT